MRNYLISMLLVLTTTAAACAPLPARAALKLYQEVSGKDSFRLAPEGLDALKSLGLSLASIESGAVPDPGYTYALGVVSPYSDPSSTTFFNYDDRTGALEILGGTLKVDGNILFNVDTAKLALPPQLDFGKFSVPFASGPTGPSISIATNKDTVAKGLHLFDVVLTAPPVVDLASKSLELGLEFDVSKEFSDFLVDAGASKPMAGLKFAETRGYRGIEEVDAAKVPEPGSALAILMVPSAVLAMRRRKG